MEKNYDFIIWDWNGTLYDDVKAGIDTINSMLVERNIASLTLERYKKIFGFPIIDYYKKAGFDFSREPYEKLAAIFIERNNARLGESFLSEGAKSALEFIKNSGTRQLILSATRHDILERQTGLFDIGHYFCALLGNSDFYAYGKTEIAKNWIKEQNLDPKKMLLIGDTVHDYEVAKAIGCHCLLVSAGHQSKEVLGSTGCKIVDSISEVIKEL